MKIPEKAPVVTDLYNVSDSDLKELFHMNSGQTDEAGKFRQLVRLFNGSDYIHWDNLRRKQLPYDPKLVWLFLKIQRGHYFHTIRIGKGVFRYIILEKFQKELHNIDKASPASFEWLPGEAPSETDKRRYLINSLMEEAIASSQLEGAATTREVAKKFLREGKKPKNKSEQMILNNYRTIQTLHTLKSQPLTGELIRNIHQEITKGTLESEQDEVEFRDSNDIAVHDKRDPSIKYYHPPDFTEIPDLINGLCLFTNNEEEFIHPIIKGIIIHFLVGYIHPFNDGNGRTARALFYWFVLKHRYDLFEYLSISRIFVHAPMRYTLAYLLTETDENDMTYFIDFNIDIISKAMEDLKQYIIEKRKEELDSIQLVEQIPDITFRQADILKEFITRPSRRVTVNEIAGKFKISLPTARSDLVRLEEMGKIKAIKDGIRFIYVYNG